MPLGLNRMASHWDAFFWIHICMHTFFSIFNLMISQSDRMVKLGMYIRNGGQCWQTSGSFFFLEKCHCFNYYKFRSTCIALQPPISTDYDQLHYKNQNWHQVKWTNLNQSHFTICRVSNSCKGTCMQNYVLGGKGISTNENKQVLTQWVLQISSPNTEWDTLYLKLSTLLMSKFFEILKWCSSISVPVSWFVQSESWAAHTMTQKFLPWCTRGFTPD